MIIAALAVSLSLASPVNLIDMNDHSASVIDARSVAAQDGDLVRFDYTVIYADGSPYNGRTMRVVVTPYTLDCKTPRFATAGATYMTLDETVLAIDDTPRGEWEPMAAGSAMTKVRAWLCEGAPAPVKAAPMDRLRQAEVLYFNAIGRPGVLSGR